MTIAPMTIADDKKSLRREAASLRFSLARSAPDAAAAIAQKFCDAISYQAGTAVSGYVAARGELDPAPLMQRLRMAGCALALARVAAVAQPLHFHLWREGEIPVESAFGVMEAAPEWPRIVPDIILVPLLGFDEKGYRLGYGGGFYDRTLQSMRRNRHVVAVGIAFAGQEMILPHDEHDEKLDWIVTEKFAKKFAGKLDSKRDRIFERD